MRNATISLISLALATVSSVALADISVQYNGQSIPFTDAKPKMSDGRVLVPLRAVLEGMRVDVKFDPATSLITGTQNETVVKLQLGSREATINDRIVVLDVPAQAVNGRTFIPLRFFGEAFGAEVKWRSFDETVLITRDINITGGTQPPINGTLPSAFSLRHNGEAWVTGGQTINFELTGTPNQAATLYLNDGAVVVPFNEYSSGKYAAQYTVPTKQTKRVAFQDADAFAVIGQGTNRVAIKTNQAIRVDNDNPNIANLSPDRLAKIVQRRPAITAELVDGEGSGVNKDSVKLWINGKDVTNDAYIANNLLVYKPTTDLNVGKYEIKVSAKDMAGNLSEVATEFEIVAASNLVKDLQYTGPAQLEPGDQIKFALQVNPDVSSVRVRFGDSEETRSASLAPDGKVTFVYTVSKNDSFDDTNVSFLLKMQNGDVLEYVAEQSLTMAGASTPIPKVTTPTAGADLGDAIVFTGTAEKAQTVTIKVDYVSSILGLLETRGTVGVYEVEVDKNGHFTSPNIRLSGPLGSNPDQYQVTFISVSEKGRQSEPVTITYKG